MAPINVAVLGAGIFVKEEHLPAVLATPLLNLKAIYSRSLKSAKATAEKVPASNGQVDLYSSDSGAGRELKDLLARDDISAVIIALPIRDQPQYIEQALRAGKHVLAEKPAGPDVATAEKLLETYRGIAKDNNVTWAVAENFRFVPKFVWAAEQAKKLGRVIGFNFRMFHYMKADNKYLETEWRKNPTHNYGLILDAGVHFAAVVRLLIGDDAVASTAGYSALAQKRLPPVDTLSAALKTKGGAVGSFNISVGTTMEASEHTVACEQGSVTVDGDKAYVIKDGQRQEEREFPWQSGVTEEVQAWAAALAEGKPNPLQSPEQGLADLELLEAMLKSADENGTPKALARQV